VKQKIKKELPLRLFLLYIARVPARVLKMNRRIRTAIDDATTISFFFFLLVGAD